MIRFDFLFFLFSVLRSRLRHLILNKIRLLVNVFSCAERLARICMVPALFSFGEYQGFWTSGQRETDSCGSSVPFRWKVSAENSLSVDYTNWYSNQPSCSNSNETCLHLTTPDWYNEQWNDLNCAWPLCAMCEMDLWHCVTSCSGDAIPADLDSAN